MKAFRVLAYLLLFILVFSISACEEEDQPQPVSKLQAHAGADQQAVVGRLVTLNGTASTDGAGQPFTYAWTIKNKPATSTATLALATTAAPTFTPDLAGTYVVEIKIANSIGFATDEVTITATNGDTGGSTDPVTIFISEDITQDRVLEDIFTDAAKADYIVTKDVKVTAKLTVKPGVRIEFEQNKGLSVYPQGALIAKALNSGTGSQEKRITFAGKQPIRGFWKGLFFDSNSPLNELEYVTIAHAGSSSHTELVDIKTAIGLIGSSHSGASLKMKGTVVQESAGYGLYLQGISELLAFETNYFSDNAASAAYVPARQLHKLDFYSHFSGNNGFNGVETGGEITGGAEVMWPDFNDGSGYYASTDISIKAGVRLQAGSKMDFKEGVTLRVLEEGYLNAIGTDASKIIFTARNQSGNLNWGGIMYHSNSSQNKLAFAEVSYAGNKEIPFYPGMKANVAVAPTAKASIENTLIKQGLGWGILAFTDKGAQLNTNAATANSFEVFHQGYYKLTSGEPNANQLAGEWLDQKSFEAGLAIDALFYDKTANRWFRGASSPWTMNPRAGMGLKIDAAGNYIWTITQEHDNAGGCGNPYSAEYITGKVAANGDQLQFQENFWRTKFYNPCDVSQNIDTNVTPGNMSLKYRIDRIYNVWTGEATHWQITFTNPDGTFFRFYKQ